MKNLAEVNKIVRDMSILKDVEVNKMASDFIGSRYDEVIISANKIASKMVGRGYSNISVADVVHDVYASLVKDERLGNGFNLEMGIQLDQFVYGRIKRYMMNNKYRGINKRSYSKETYSEVSASSSEEMEYIYDTSADMRDDIERTINTVDIEEELYTCLRSAKDVGINLKELILNPETFICDSMASVLPTLKSLLSVEGLESLKNILEYEDRSLMSGLFGRVENMINIEDGCNN